MSTNPPLPPSASIIELSPSSEAQPPAIPASILSSLVNPSSSSSSRKSRPPIRTLSETAGQSELADSSDDGKSTVGIYCPRKGCGCLILRKGDAVWREGEGGMYDSSGPFPPPPTPTPATTSSSSSEPSTTTTTTTTTPYWYISNSPFGFENAGFSRNVPSSITHPKGGGKLKYLICADCDLGPLGWSTEGGKEAWVAVERVGYGV